LLGGDPLGLGRLSAEQEIEVLAYHRYLHESGLLGPLGLFGATRVGVGMPARPVGLPDGAKRSRRLPGVTYYPGMRRDMLKDGWTPEQFAAAFG